MRQIPPQNLIITTTVSREIAGHTFDFRLSYTAFGEVLAIQEDFSKLPDYAAKMMFGEKKEQVEKSINVWTKALIAYLPFYKKGIFQEIKINGIDLMTTERYEEATPFTSTKYKALILDVWTFKIWELAAILPNYLNVFCQMMISTAEERRFASYYLYTLKENTLAEKTLFGEFLFWGIIRLAEIEASFGETMAFLLPKFMLRDVVDALLEKHEISNKLQRLILKNYQFSELKFHNKRKAIYRDYGLIFESTFDINNQDFSFELKV